ncbi:MAG: Tfp pilus assembly protein PilE, partial [Candidatus Saccharimonadales bacterium]
MLSHRTEAQQQGFVLATLMAFIPLVAILSVLAISLGLQAYQTSIRQDLIRQAQLASTTAMEFAKEQYELDIMYTGTPETTLYTTDLHVVTYEVVHKGFSNALNTQQDIQGVGRVYRVGDVTPQYVREIQGKLTYTAGGTSSVRFIFIVDNSWSMSTTDWLDSKGTIDSAIDYVLTTVPTAELGVIQYGTGHYSQAHKYDVTVPFTSDAATAKSWDRRYGHSSPSYY